jgi:RimJ/RimL family protein N-acetyltransferase
LPKRGVSPIVGHGVRLRLLEADDLERTRTWRNIDDNRCWFIQSDPVGRETHQSWFESYQVRDDDFVFIVEDLEGSCEAIGQASLYHIDWERGSAEFGRLLIGELAARGRGLGFEATRTLLHFGFEVWRLRRIHLEVFAHNSKAIAIYTRCGFRTMTPVAREGLITMELSRAAWACTAEQRVSLIGLIR